jgi:hypothetical protein
MIAIRTNTFVLSFYGVTALDAKFGFRTVDMIAIRTNTFFVLNPVVSCSNC